MSLPNPETVVTEERLSEFYTELLPYLGGSADAGFTPVGTVIAVMSNHAPANYLICDGTVYNIADYPELANHFLNEFGSKNKFGGNGTTTFAVPNLSGEFLRMTGTNSHANQGSGAAVGTHQNATQIPNMRTYRSGTSGNIGGFSNNDKSSCVVQNADFMSSITNSVIYYDNAKQNSGEQKADNYTTRPTNTSVLFCIATKNIYLNPSNDYSTDEKVVGTWIDGKTLYQRTFVTTQSYGYNSSNSYRCDINEISTSNIDCLIDTKIMVASGSGQIPPFRAAKNSETQKLLTMLSYVNIDSGFTMLSGAFITLQYTKFTT